MVRNTPAANAARREESRHDQWWYPQRCELPGCSETGKDALKKCSGCKMVQYCCKQHQQEDWEAHRAECKTFRRLGLSSTFYTDEDMLRRFPLRPCGTRSRQPGRVEVERRRAECRLCGRRACKEKLTRTDCSTGHDYQPGTFSRDFCQRSHDRYTLCGHHGVERSCDTSKDWRECPGCVSRGPRPGDVADMLWRGLNSYNFAPLLSKDVPRHSRCEQCVTCKQRFMLGVEGGSINDKGKVCLKCALAAVGASPEMLASGRLPLPTFQYDPPSSTDQPTPAGL